MEGHALAACSHHVRHEGWEREERGGENKCTSGGGTHSLLLRAQSSTQIIVVDFKWPIPCEPLLSAVHG